MENTQGAAIIRRLAVAVACVCLFGAITATAWGTETDDAVEAAISKVAVEERGPALLMPRACQDADSVVAGFSPARVGEVAVRLYRSSSDPAMRRKAVAVLSALAFGVTGPELPPSAVEVARDALGQQDAWMVFDAARVLILLGTAQDFKCVAERMGSYADGVKKSGLLGFVCVRAGEYPHRRMILNALVAEVSRPRPSSDPPAVQVWKRRIRWVLNAATTVAQTGKMPPVVADRVISIFRKNPDLADEGISYLVAAHAEHAVSQLAGLLDEQRPSREVAPVLACLVVLDSQNPAWRSRLIKLAVSCIPSHPQSRDLYHVLHWSRFAAAHLHDVSLDEDVWAVCQNLSLEDRGDFIQCIMGRSNGESGQLIVRFLAKRTDEELRHVLLRDRRMPLTLAFDLRDFALDRARRGKMTDEEKAARDRLLRLAMEASRRPGDAENSAFP